MENKIQWETEMEKALAKARSNGKNILLDFSDHVVAKPGRFRTAVRSAFGAAASGDLVVVGIEPRWPETGYGYLEFPRGAKAGGAPLPVRRFHEKPGLAKAKRYLAAGNFYWNSGMFFWRADTLLEQLRQHLPRTATVLASLPRFVSRRFYYILLV